MNLVLALLLSGSGPELRVVQGADAVFAAVRAANGPVVVHFWATWCDTCLKELPEVTKLASGHGGSLLWVSLDPPGQREAVERFMREHGMLAEASSPPLLLDAQDPGPITSRFDPGWQGQLPATFLVLHSGEIVARHLGRTPVVTVLEEVQRFSKPKGPERPEAP